MQAGHDARLLKQMQFDISQPQGYFSRQTAASLSCR